MKKIDFAIDVNYLFFYVLYNEYKGLPYILPTIEQLRELHDTLNSSELILFNRRYRILDLLPKEKLLETAINPSKEFPINEPYAYLAWLFLFLKKN